MGVTRSYSRALRGGGWGARAIRGWQTRRDRRRHGSPQLVPGCRHQLGQVPLRLLLSSAGGQTKQGKASYSEREREREGCWEWETEEEFSGLRGQILHM